VARLTDSQIAGYAKSAGVSGSNLAISVAIALAESGGNPTAHNAIPPDNSYGLWQINMLGPLGPQRRSMLGISSNDALFDPATNARAMFKLSGGGQHWTPWTTYTSGRYRLYMARGTAAAGNPTGGTAGGSTTPVGLTDSLGNISKAVDTLSDPHTWVRVGYFVVGFILLIIAAFRLTGDNKLSDTTKTIAKVAAKVAVK
jgi:hypothetical protein